MTSFFFLRILFCYKMYYYANLVCNLYIYDNYDWNLALNIFPEFFFSYMNLMWKYAIMLNLKSPFLQDYTVYQF